ncbi:MAG TPA: C40 family peptidase [Trebonia sp.]|nr:C40 family peptidase [Trebonia sp.]
MPTYRLAGNPGPGAAALRGAQGLVKERAAAAARAQAHVTAVTAVLTQLQTQAETATESYDRAAAQEQQAATAYQAAASRLVVARSTSATAQRRVAAQAVADYEAQGGAGPMAVLLGGPGGPDAYLNAVGAEQALASQRTDSLAASKADTVVASVFSAQAATLLAQQKADVASVQALRLAAQAAVDHQAAAVRAAQSAQGQAAALLAIARTNNAKLQAEHEAALLAQQRAAAAQARAAQQARDEAAREAAAARTGNQQAASPPSAAGTTTGPSWSAGSGATAGQGDTAADWALTQMGKPYQWGAAGPATYDCSGLAMDAWAKAGIQLGHYTGWQWPSGPHIPLNDLRRGDLVFYATNTADPNTIHHVGIYIGGGMMVDAPYTGAFVRIDSIYEFSGLIGATRPAN